MTLAQLRKIMPNCSEARAAALLPFLNAALTEASVDTPWRVAAFVAQLAHESGELRYFEELASGTAYEGRKDLGNTEPGDGKRFKGRGPIQLTGRSNYRAAGAELALPLEAVPEMAASPEHGFRIAAWYWKKHGLNERADAGPLAFDSITRRINGGLNGKVDRDRFYARAMQALGLTR